MYYFLKLSQLTFQNGVTLFKMRKIVYILIPKCTHHVDFQILSEEHVIKEKSDNFQSRTSTFLCVHVGVTFHFEDIL